MKHYSMVWNLPNTLTWLRIFAIPLVIVLFYLPFSWADPAAGLLFALAGITDSLDGYFARRMGQTSRLGAFLDPVADKLIVAVALVLLVSKDMPKIVVPGLEGMDGGHATLRAETVSVILVLCSVVIIGREIAISALREWMAEIGQRGKVKVSQMAKYKTILQIVGLSCMLFRWDLPLFPGVSLPVFEIGLVLTIVAAFLTLISAISYLRAAWPDLHGTS
jgi:CDP-diacylglycerol---glycerol-3-phosphate 3-phosphatidyltransferase